MSENTNKEIARRVWSELWSRGNLDSLDELIAEGYVRHEPRPGRDDVVGKAGFRAMLAASHASFPDLITTLDEQIAEGDKVTNVWTSTGTQRAQWQEIAATGKTIHVSGITISRIEDAKIAEEWSYWDQAGLRDQLGG